MARPTGPPGKSPVSPYASPPLLTGTRKRGHISPVLASLHWLPVKFRIEFKILLLNYKALHGQAPSYLKELIVPYYPTRTLCSLNAGLLVVPIVSKSRTGARAFSYQAPLQWNQLPVVVREADTLSTFKSRLKTFLFDKAYSAIQIKLNFNTLLLVFKSLKGVGPNYLHDMFKRSLRSQHKQLLLKPTIRTKQGEAAFSHYGVHLWNQLPETIKNAPTIAIFKS
ncbi:hypothetical protein N1851_027827 [Merluccius polli]|uniref:Uncharacterized protein n=1 Tax=Merluccius polli TaxID=89951 RepID=A0AA47MA24_MERPO|nr:hypothetical protein N1851_027827 [Merluccius polli]